MHARGLLVFALAICCASGAEPLKTLYDAHEWFRLREAISAGNAAPLYRGAVAYAFHELPQAEQELRRAIRLSPESDQAMEARGLLIYLAQLKGDFRQALSGIRAIQALTPGSHGLDDGAAFFGAFAEYPKQRVSRRRAAAVPYRMIAGNLFIPVSVNGKSSNYLLDTGANFSLLSESEAGRLGLSIHAAPGASTTDSAGNSVAFRVALADRLSVGAFEIRNVPFLVVGDDLEPFAHLPAGSHGVLGIPVALAFETIRWNDSGRFEIGFDAPRSARLDANLCFDGANPMVRAEYQRNPITVFLDTGATTTRLMPAFARDFPDTVRGAATGVTTVRGVAGSTHVDSATLPQVTLRFGGKEAILKPADVLLRNPEGKADRFHVWAGLDVFERAHNVTIDFRSMRFVVE